MALVIQATTISNKIIDGARWEVQSPTYFARGQKVSVELPTKDAQLLGYLSKNMNNDCMLDGTKDHYSVVMACVVNEVRHMVYVASQSADTMVIVLPTNRLVEHVLQYILSPTKCDPRFVRAVRGDAGPRE